MTLIPWGYILGIANFENIGVRARIECRTGSRDHSVKAGLRKATMGDFTGIGDALEKMSLPDSLSLHSQRTGKAKGGDDIVLEKKVGLGGSVALVVGVIIGSGIFISPAGVAANAGSVGLSLLLWGIGGIITMLASLCMAELGTMIQSSGGEYSYIKLGLADWLAYIWAWTQCLLLRPAGSAIVIITCAEYILTPVYNDGCGPPPQFYQKLLSAVLCLFLATINVWSVRLAAGIQIIFTVAKIIALLIIIIGGIVQIANGNTEYLATGFEGTTKDPGLIILAFYSAMFAYDGWNNLNAVTEEVINPAWTLPMAMYIGIPMIIVLYMLANVSYLSVMSIEELVTTPAVGMLWAQRVIPAASWVIPLCVAMSTFGACNGALFTIGRLFYTAAKGGHTLKIFSYIHIKNVTPMPAIIVSTIFTMIYALTGKVGVLLDFMSFAIWLFYFITMLAMIVLRFKEPYKSMHRPYKVPIFFPFVVCIFSLVLVVVPMALAPQVEFAYAALVIGIGFIFYFPFVLCKVPVPWMKDVTKFFQLVMEVVPPADLDDDEDSIKKET